MKHVVLIIFLIFTAPYTGAVENSNCYKNLHKFVGSNDGYENDVNLNSFKAFDNVLFLSDGVGSPFHWSNAEALARIYPEKRIVSADYNISEEGFINNTHFIKVDNRERLPFLDNEFEVIVMRRGLCVCSPGATCCGGPHPSSSEIKSFFHEVVRVLDKKKKGSIAILHGASNTGVVNKTNTWNGFWKTVFTELEKLHPIKVKFIESSLSTSLDPDYASIEITVR